MEVWSRRKRRRKKENRFYPLSKCDECDQKVPKIMCPVLQSLEGFRGPFLLVTAKGSSSSSFSSAKGLSPPKGSHCLAVSSRLSCLYRRAKLLAPMAWDYWRKYPALSARG